VQKQEAEKKGGKAEETNGDYAANQSTKKKKKAVGIIKWGVTVLGNVSYPGGKKRE